MKCFLELEARMEVRGESARKSSRDERTTIRFCKPDKESFLPRYRLPGWGSKLASFSLKPRGEERKRVGKNFAETSRQCFPRSNLYTMNDA